MLYCPNISNQPKHVLISHLLTNATCFSTALMPNKQTSFCTVIIRSIQHCYTTNSTTTITLRFQNSQVGSLKKVSVELIEKNATTHLKTTWS